MSDISIRIENLSKAYKLGVFGYGMLSKDFQSWWARARGKEDPNAKVIQSVTAGVEDRSCLAEGKVDPNVKHNLVQSKQSANDLFWALRNISVEIKKGEILGVIGANGAGKSTLLKILSRITKPTEGRAEINGRVGSLLEVGTGFHSELTGRENIYLNGTILGMKKKEIENKIDEIIDFAGVETFIDTPVKRYSSGMHVRLAFAVAAHLEPEIMIVDEVLAVGDAAFQKKCLGKMEEARNEEGRTILFVSHDMAAISRLCDRVLLLNSGELMVDDTTDKVVDLYLKNVVNASSSKVWDSVDEAPGSDKVKLMSVKLLGPDGLSSTNVDIEDPLQVQIEYYVRQQNLKLRCVIHANVQGQLVFAALEPTEKEYGDVGLYRASVTIPGNLLGEYEYSITVNILSSSGIETMHVAETDVISFQVFDPMTGNSARGDYTKRFRGVVRPLLVWENELIEST